MKVNKFEREFLKKNKHLVEELKTNEKQFIELTKEQMRVLEIVDRHHFLSFLKLGSEDWKRKGGEGFYLFNVYRVPENTLEVLRDEEPAKFVEFDIDENGLIKGFEYKKHWLDAMHRISQFAGVKYKGFNGWYMHRKIVEDEQIWSKADEDTEEDVIPVIPERIRFFTDEYWNKFFEKENK